MSQDKHTFDGMIYAEVTLYSEVSHIEVNQISKYIFGYASF